MFNSCIESLTKFLVGLIWKVGLERENEDGQYEEDADHEGGKASEAEDTERSRQGYPEQNSKTEQAEPKSLSCMTVYKKVCFNAEALQHFWHGSLKENAVRKKETKIAYYVAKAGESQALLSIEVVCHFFV